MNSEPQTATDRMEADMWRDARGRLQRHFIDHVCADLLDGVRAYPRVPGELPEHDIVMTSEGPDAMLERFKREPDMLASFLPEGFAVVDVAAMSKFMQVLRDMVPLTDMLGGRSLGPVSGKEYAEMVLRQSADRLFGMSETARRQHERSQP